MFGNKEKDRVEQPAMRPAPDRKEKTVLAEGTSFNGILKVQGSVTLNGDFEGTITCTGSVAIGKAGKVKAEIEAHDAVVAGHLQGKIFAQDRVELQGGSHFVGDVHAKSFMIQDGVFFQGNCTMGETRKSSTPPAASPDGRQPELGILKQS